MKAKKLVMVLTASMVVATASPAFALYDPEAQLKREMMQKEQGVAQDAGDLMFMTTIMDEPAELPEGEFRITAIMDGVDQEVAEDMVKITAVTDEALPEGAEYRTTAVEEKKGFFQKIASFFQNIFGWLKA